MFSIIRFICLLMLLIINIGCATSSSIHAGSSDDDLLEALKKSVNQNGTATIQNTKLPADYRRATHIGIFFNHTNNAIDIINPDFNTPELTIYPGEHGFLPVKTIPDEVFIKSWMQRIPRRVKTYIKKKEYYSIMVEFGAIIEN